MFPDGVYSLIPLLNYISPAYSMHARVSLLPFLCRNNWGKVAESVYCIAILSSIQFTDTSSNILITHIIQAHCWRHRSAKADAISVYNPPCYKPERNVFFCALIQRSLVGRKIVERRKEETVGKRHHRRVFQLGALSTTGGVPCSSIIEEKKQTSLQPISPKQRNTHQNNGWIALRVRGNTDPSFM